MLVSITLPCFAGKIVAQRVTIGCEADFADSKNQGFTVLDRDALTCKVRYLGEEFIWKKGEETRLAEGLQKLIDAVVSDYAYLL